MRHEYKRKNTFFTSAFYISTNLTMSFIRFFANLISVYLQIFFAPYVLFRGHSKICSYLMTVKLL